MIALDYLNFERYKKLSCLLAITLLLLGRFAVAAELQSM
jgi:hypothetical protein